MHYVEEMLSTIVNIIRRTFMFAEVLLSIYLTIVGFR